MKDFTEFLDTTIDLNETEKFKLARADVLRILKRLKPGRKVTFGHLSVAMNQNLRSMLSDVLRDLAADRIVTWDPMKPSPSYVTKL